MAVYQENFLSIRKLYPRVSERLPSTRMAVADPASATERDYRDLLSEANLNFFHREYSIALQNYLALRQKILERPACDKPATAVFTAPDKMGVRMEYLSTSLRLATEAWVITGKYPL